jgi:penicillin amidase
MMKQMIAGQISNDNSLLDNIETKTKETRSEILSQSFKEAVVTLKNNWNWFRIGLGTEYML